MKHSYRPECGCDRCAKERERRTTQSMADPRRVERFRANTRRRRRDPMERWAENYDRLNGAPENEEDR